jgi:hypothetical protein
VATDVTARTPSMLVSFVGYFQVWQTFHDLKKLVLCNTGLHLTGYIVTPAQAPAWAFKGIPLLEWFNKEHLVIDYMFDGLTK